MRAEVTGTGRLEQTQYQSSELLIAVLTHGFRVEEVPATIHKRKVGESKKGHNAIYGLKYAGVVLGTWWRERQRRGARARVAAAARAGRARRPREGAAPLPPPARGARPPTPRAPAAPAARTAPAARRHP